MARSPEQDERWNRIEQLFHAALDKPAGDRADFLDEACGNDHSLRLEVESLVKASDRGHSLMEQPALAHLGLAASAWGPGTTFGHYRIVEHLGAGGMGEVFRAHDLHLNRDVALKTIPPNLYLDGQYLERLRREGRTLGSVNHPNVASLYAIEEWDGRVAMVMELVEGETLARRLTRSKIAIGEMLSVAIQICEAVEAAHRKRIIHRDLKPGNVMIARGGLVKVLDFGLAKRGPNLRQETSDFTRTTPLTSPGAVLGTPGYMSPEQVEGVQADERSDIFSFGAILYEMVAGRAAFDGNTASQRLASAIRDEPPPLDGNTPIAGQRVARLALRCLRKSPDERYQNITDVKFALQEIKEGVERDAPIATSSSITRRRLVWGGALAASGAALSYTALQFRRRDPLPIVVTPLTMYEGYADAPALSPDGKMVVFTWGGERQDNVDVYLSVIGSNDPLRLTSNPAREVNPI